MRAFMSTGGKRHYIVEPDEDGVCDIIAGITPTRTREEKQALATAEVRRILAETETVNGCMPLSCFNGRLADVRQWIDTDFRAPKRALAGALRAFVGEE